MFWFTCTMGSFNFSDFIYHTFFPTNEYSFSKRLECSSSERVHENRVLSSVPWCWGMYLLLMGREVSLIKSNWNKLVWCNFWCLLLKRWNRGGKLGSTGWKTWQAEKGVAKWVAGLQCRSRWLTPELLNWSKWETVTFGVGLRVAWYWPLAPMGGIREGKRADVVPWMTLSVTWQCQ